MPTAPHAAPAREVLVARQPVLDAEMNLLGFELLLDGAAVVVDALSEIGLETLTGGHAAWLPLGRELLLDGGVPVRSDRVVLQVADDDGDDEALVEAVRQLAERGACVALDRFAHRPGLEPLLDLAWGVKIDLAAHGADGARAQLGALAGRDLMLIATSVDPNEDLVLHEASHKLLEIIVRRQVVEAASAEVAEKEQASRAALGAREAELEVTRQAALTSE